jgi:Putative MetA-pathway of phenol degradation
VKTILATACLLALLGTQPVRGCDLCAIYAATEAQAGQGNGFYAGVAEQYTYFDTLQSQGDTVSNDGEYIHSLVSQLYVGYRFNDRVGVQFNVPMIYREFGSNDGSGHESGFGDMSLIGTFAVWQECDPDYNVNWSLLGGVKFPTGDPSRLNPNEPDVATGIGGHDLALGSGSFDGLAGTSVFARWKRLMATASTQYAIRTTGAYGYRYANDLTWMAGPGYYLILADDHSLALQCIVSGDTKGQDSLQGVATGDTAETIVYLGPQLTFTWSSRLSALLGVDLPVFVHSTGDQLMPDLRVRAAVTWKF